MLPAPPACVVGPNCGQSNVSGGARKSNSGSRPTPLPPAGPNTLAKSSSALSPKWGCVIRGGWCRGEDPYPATAAAVCSRCSGAPPLPPPPPPPFPPPPAPPLLTLPPVGEGNDAGVCSVLPGGSGGERPWEELKPGKKPDWYACPCCCC